uniref:Uncharacterized protein n=1 Tax=Cucumis sativus TaxID=3659 RepID=A0A0A0L2S4_CUCSA
MASEGSDSKDKTTSNKLLDGLKYNVEVAESVANEAQRLPILEATPLYEQLLTVYPTAEREMIREGSGQGLPCSRNEIC